MPPEIAAILVELARSIQRFGMYPRGHPARRETASQFIGHLNRLHETHQALPFEFTRSRILFDGQPTPSDNKLLSALARRINQHEVAVVEFLRGVAPEEVDGFLEAVSVQPGKTGEPLGERPSEQLRRWPHIRVETVEYDALSLARGRGDAEGTSSEAPADWGERREAGQVEGAETVQPFGDGYEGGDEEGGEEDAESLRRQIARLILDMDAGTLEKLTRVMPEVAPAEGLDPSMVAALTQVLREAASRDGENPSAELMRLITKLGMHGEDAPGAPGEEGPGALSELVRRLGSGWDAEDPNPGDYRAALTGLSRKSSVLAREPVWVDRADPERVLQMSLELDEAEAPTRAAARQMVDSDRIGALLDILDGAPEGVDAVERVWEWLAHPRALRRLLQRDPVDLGALDRLLARMGVEAAETLFEVLEGTAGAEERRGALTDRLGGLGPGVVPGAMGRLDSDDPLMRRDMLRILRGAGGLPGDFTAAPYMADPDAGVRREAMQLGLSGFADREMVLTAALGDSDPGIVQWGIRQAEEECPPEVLPYLVSVIFQSSSPSSVRLAAIRALGTVDAPEALHALLRLTWKRRFLWFHGLTPKSAEMLEALRVLSERWQQDERARKVLARAARSKDPQVKALARRGGGG
ncbi:MAG: hypothetical protein R6W82_10945 [bacterium]